MFIYEVVFETDSDELRHQVYSAESENDAIRKWEENYNEGEVLGVEQHGDFNNPDHFEEVLTEITNNGVPEDYK